MRKLIVPLVVGALALAAGTWFFLVRSDRGAAAPLLRVGTPVAAPGPVRADGRIVAEARVVPVRHVTLSLPSGGVVETVPVQEGAQVEAAQPLVRLGAARQQAAVSQASADLRRAQARLAELQAGARPQELAAAKAGVEAAQGQLDRIRQGARTEQIAAAEAERSASRALLQQTMQGPEQQQLIAAAAELANAEASVRQAQAAYDLIKGDPYAARKPEALQLEQATNGYEAARARWLDLKKGPRDAVIAGSRAQVQRTEAALAVLNAPVRPADVAEARAAVRGAQAQLELVEAGARPETIAVAQAEINAAEAALAQAQAALAETELRAPFSGSVISLDVRPGEQSASVASVVRLADLSDMQIETTDLTEQDVVNVREGNAALITFDALPGVELTGKVERIRRFGESKQGDITYTLVVRLDRQDSRLLWNMTASVAIEPGK